MKVISTRRHPLRFGLALAVAAMGGCADTVAVSLTWQHHATALLTHTSAQLQRLQHAADLIRLLADDWGEARPAPAGARSVPAS